ncbi:MAG: ECF transporter S component [Anaerolineae bacterium]|nr:ECF transporter S component [Anaerolineae bacterium]
MDKKLLSVAGTLVAILVIVMGAVLVVGNMLGNENFQTGENPVLRFVFVAIGLLIAFAVYYFTKENKIWEVETRHVVYMAIGAALYALFSYLFNGTVFVIPSLSQVSLRPAIAIPMFFGYTFGPVVGFFAGAVGNMFGDALTGFGLSPQWSIGNGLVGFISGMVFLFKDKKKSMDTVLYVSGALALLAAVLFFLNQSMPNMLFYDVENGIFGDQQISIFAGISIVIGFVLVLAVRFGFAKNEDIAAAVTWASLGNLLGIGFAAISDIWINGFSLTATIVGQFLPAAGPNLIFAAVLVPMLVLAYAAVQRQSGR